MTGNSPHHPNRPSDPASGRHDGDRPGSSGGPFNEPDGDVVPGDPPVPITVWHLPQPVAGTLVSAPFVRRLIANYTRPGAHVVDLTTTGLDRAPTPVDLIISAWPIEAAVTAEDHLAACRARLAAGGCVALVLTSTQTPDHLGTLVHAARIAGLTYLQHVVAAHQLNPAIADPRPRHQRPRRNRRAPHLRVHSDLLIFRLRSEK